MTITEETANSADIQGSIEDGAQSTTVDATKVLLDSTQETIKTLKAKLTAPTDSVTIRLDALDKCANKLQQRINRIAGESSVA